MVRIAQITSLAVGEVMDAHLTFAARSPGSTFFLQIDGFCRAASVPPGSARFPIGTALVCLIRHRAESGENISPGRFFVICRHFFATGRRAEGNAQGHLLCLSGYGVGVSL